MEVSVQIKKFQEFLELNYKTDLLEKIRKGSKYLVVDFSLLSSFEPELANLLLDQPEETIKACEIAVEQFDLPGDVKDFKIRIRNLPPSLKVLIRDIRSNHLEQFITLEGVVRQKSDVRPRVTTARFECPNCGNIISVLQLDKQFKEPTKCGCGRKGKFRILSKELIDAQGIKLEESTEDLEGGEQPKRLNILLKNDLVSPISEKKTNPGQSIKMTGIIKEVPIIMRNGALSTNFDLIFEANHLESIEEQLSDIKISEEEEKEIIKISKRAKVYEQLKNSIAPSIYGHERVKEALLLQIVGGVKKIRDDGVVTRGDMHVLLIGDPGAGKSQILKRIQTVSPKSRFVSGKGASGAGLTASVVKDEFLSGWSLEAGALVLANKGICCIDEFDKMDKEDRAAMHEALEQQTVTISKANIQATLRAETTVLAAANPKFGRFDPYSTIAEQIELPTTLINRFDLIFPIKDLPDEKKDSELASFILDLHKKQNVDEAEIPTNMLRKYFAYAKKLRPKLTDGAIEELKDYFLKMRGSVSGDSTKSIPISARQLEGLIRLSEAYAKLRLAEKVTKGDAKNAVDLLHFCLRQIALDEETGTIDIDKIATGIPASQRNKIMTIKDVISELENKLGKTIPIDDIIEIAKERGIEEDKTEEVIERLKRAGDIFEPKRGFVQKI